MHIERHYVPDDIFLLLEEAKKHRPEYPAYEQAVERRGEGDLIRQGRDTALRWDFTMVTKTSELAILLAALDLEPEMEIKDYKSIYLCGEAQFNALAWGETGWDNGYLGSSSPEELPGELGMQLENMLVNARPPKEPMLIVAHDSLQDTVEAAVRRYE